MFEFGLIVWMVANLVYICVMQSQERKLRKSLRESQEQTEKALATCNDSLKAAKAWEHAYEEMKRACDANASLIRAWQHETELWKGHATEAAAKLQQYQNAFGDLPE